VVRRNGSSGGQVAEKVTISLPPELTFLLREYEKSRRFSSLSETVRRLVESHPDLLSFTCDLYTGKDTSPQSP